jgi:enoyl-[acyl-carrier-protein] reductase (NADH)
MRSPLVADELAVSDSEAGLSAIRIKSASDCPRDGFLTAMEVSCWSFLDLARRAERLMREGGTMITMSYLGANEVVENYGIMGPVEAALESANCYVATELGPKGIRVHAISPGLAGDPRRRWNPRLRRPDVARLV